MQKEIFKNNWKRTGMTSQELCPSGTILLAQERNQKGHTRLVQVGFISKDDQGLGHRIVSSDDSTTI